MILPLQLMEKMLILKVLKIALWQAGYLLTRHQRNLHGTQIHMVRMANLGGLGGWEILASAQMVDILTIGIRY